jgi:cyanophycinase
MKWMIDRSGGGRFVVLRASGTNAYSPYIYRDLGGVHSCETLILQTRGAGYDLFAVNQITCAEALFIAGGDQWDYVRLWQGTAIEDAIHTAAARGVPVGGTSAGLAILGEFAFSGEHGTVTSLQALGNPFHPHLTLSHDFLHLPFLGGVIADSHFVTRDRMGRLVTFLARMLADGLAPRARAIGVDEKTALAVDDKGLGTLFGEGAVYFLEARETPEVCHRGAPLTFHDVSVVRISGGGAQFDLASWMGEDGSTYRLSAVEGVLRSTQLGGSVY